MSRKKEKRAKIQYQSLPTLFKQIGIYLPEIVESTPIIFQEKLLLVVFLRHEGNSFGSGIKIYDFFTKQEIFQFEWKYGLGSAFVWNDRIYVFASSDWSKSNEIVMITIDQDFKVSNPLVVFKAKSDQKIFNTSVAVGMVEGEERFVLAYEVAEPNMKNFSIRFAHSRDLKEWSMFGSVFHPDIYAACPSIRYSQGYWYIIYLRHFSNKKIIKSFSEYVAWIARTSNFMNFEDFSGNTTYPPNTGFLSPEDSNQEGTNNSDIDLVEYKNKTYILYADGDQRTWANLRTAIFFGTMDELFREFWRA